MAGTVKKKNGDTHRQSRRGTEESPFVKWIMIVVALIFCVVFLLLPLINVFAQALEFGWKTYLNTLVDPNSRSAIRLTIIVAAIAVPLNTLFGVCAAWAVAKFNFRGKSLLITLIDLPFSVSPVVAGLMFVVLFGLNGFFGSWLENHPLHLFGKEIELKIIYAVPGIVLATMFVTFPFVARELIPVMQATGTEQEQAALTLGASGWTTFWHVTLPSVKWGLIYGIILCNARAMGEFGAVSVVSGEIVGRTLTMPLWIQSLNNGNTQASTAAAFAVASLLAVLALITLGLKTLLEWKQAREFQRAQEAPLPEAPLGDTVFLRKMSR
jgi:sulfate transport system permease protein